MKKHGHEDGRMEKHGNEDGHAVYDERTRVLALQSIVAARATKAPLLREQMPKRPAGVVALPPCEDCRTILTVRVRRLRSYDEGGEHQPGGLAVAPERHSTAAAAPKRTSKLMVDRCVVIHERGVSVAIIINTLRARSPREVGGERADTIQESLSGFRAVREGRSGPG